MNTRLKILTAIVIEELPMMGTGKIDFRSVSELVNDKVDYPDAN